jgi:Tfp pilus assembly protein PilV
MKTTGMRDMKRGATGVPSATAFTLLEVMIALGIFFMCAFAILQLVSGTLRNARALQQNEPDPGMLAAQLAITNSLSEGVESGDFGRIYPGYSWTRDVYAVGSNGIFQVDFAVAHRVGRSRVEDHLSVLFFRPNSPATVGPPKGVLQ